MEAVWVGIDVCKAVRELARALGTLGKTDQLDALVLAQFAHSSQSNGRLVPLRLADEAELELKALVVRRRQLLGMLVAETNRRERASTIAPSSRAARPGNWRWSPACANCSSP